MSFEKASDTVLVKRENKEVVSEYNIPAIKDQIKHMKSEVARLEAIVAEADKVGITEAKEDKL